MSTSLFTYNYDVIHYLLHHLKCNGNEDNTEYNGTGYALKNTNGNIRYATNAAINEAVAQPSLRLLTFLNYSTSNTVLPLMRSNILKYEHKGVRTDYRTAADIKNTSRIYFGFSTDTNTPSKSDYVLQDYISGITYSNLAVTSDNTLVDTFTNESGGELTISKFGIFFAPVHWAASTTATSLTNNGSTYSTGYTYDLLLYESLLDKPLTVPANADFQLRMVFEGNE